MPDNVTSSKNYTFEPGAHREFEELLGQVAAGRRNQNARVCTPQQLNVLGKKKVAAGSRGAQLHVKGLHALMGVFVMCANRKRR